MKEEIDNLKKELEKESPLTTEPKEEAAEDQPSLQDRILQKERELEKLIRDLNDKVRFGQKAAERPGSGAGRGGGFLDRPPSQSGPFEESRSIEFTERPRSHGTGDIWTRPADDRRAFQGGRERGFLGNRDLDRWASVVFFLAFLLLILQFLAKELGFLTRNSSFEDDTENVYNSLLLNSKLEFQIFLVGSSCVYVLFICIIHSLHDMYFPR